MNRELQKCLIARIGNEELFDVSEYDTSTPKHQKPFDDRIAKLKAEVTKLKDTIMLGDTKEALAMLEAFLKKDF